jgi:hypothetical protein
MAAPTGIEPLCTVKSYGFNVGGWAAPLYLRVFFAIIKTTTTALGAEVVVATS